MNNIDFWLALVIVLHFCYHLVAAVGVVKSLIHERKVHNKGRWTIILSVLWVILSLGLLVGVFFDHSALTCR